MPTGEAMLNSDSAITQRVTERAPRVSFWDKFSQGTQVMGEKLRARFADGIEEFHYIMDIEKLAMQPQKATANAAALRRLAGFLVDDSAGKPMPLWEGANYFRVSEKGILTAVPWTNENDFDYEIRVTTKGTILEMYRPKSETRLLETNDSLSMGTKAFLLKMLPEEYRREVSSTSRCFAGSGGKAERTETSHGH